MVATGQMMNLDANGQMSEANSSAVEPLSETVMELLRRLTNLEEKVRLRSEEADVSMVLPYSPESYTESLHCYTRPLNYGDYTGLRTLYLLQTVTIYI